MTNIRLISAKVGTMWQHDKIYADYLHMIYKIRNLNFYFGCFMSMN